MVAGAVVDHPHERLAGVGLGVEGVELGLVDRSGRADVAGGQDAARHRDQVRDEVDGGRARVRAGGRGEARELLLHLGDVAMAVDAVRLDALVDLGEHHVGLRVPAGAGHAALRVDDEVADQPRPSQRRQREQRRGGVAAGRADDARRGVGQRRELGPVQLRQAVHRVAQQVRRRMIEVVPARVVGGVGQAEVGAEIDDRGTLRDEVRDERGGGAVGEGEEDCLGVGRRLVDLEAGRGQVRVDRADGLVFPPAPDEADELARSGAAPAAGRPHRPHSRSRRRPRR